MLPDGDLLFSNLTVPPRGISRYRPSTGAFTPTWAPAVAPNGLALSADRRSVYTENDVTSEVLRIPLDAPDRSTVIGRLPGVIVGADDMASTRDGHLYVAGDIVGSIFRMDTATGAVCSIADGLDAPGPRMPPVRTHVGSYRTGWQRVGAVRHQYRRNVAEDDTAGGCRFGAVSGVTSG